MVLTNKYLKEGTRYLLLALIPVSFGLVIVGKDVFLFMFGTKYLGAAKPFVILVFSSVLFSFFLLYRRLLVALDRYRISVMITILVLAGALVLNPLFIKRFGVIGAAWATFISSAVGAIISGVYIFRSLKSNYPWLSLLRILISSIIWFYLATLVSGSNLAIRYSVYSALLLSYPVLLYIVGELTKEDWQIFKGIANK
jgi:O-antigen/teichoic acid export membrane protein